MARLEHSKTTVSDGNNDGVTADEKLLMVRQEGDEHLILTR